jgi:hypothetical protein
MAKKKNITQNDITSWYMESCLKPQQATFICLSALLKKITLMKALFYTLLRLLLMLSKKEFLKPFLTTQLLF